MLKRIKVFLVIALSVALSLSSYNSVSADPVDVADLNAQWVNNSVKITFNSNGGGAAPGEQVYVYGVERSLPGQCQMSKTGYNFIGWSTSKSAMTPDWKAGDCSHTAFGYANANTKTAKTLYAVWEQASSVTTDLSEFLGFTKQNVTPPR